MKGSSCTCLGRCTCLLLFALFLRCMLQMLLLPLLLLLLLLLLVDLCTHPLW